MSDNESNKDEDGNEKPKRPLSAYNFFLKEERKNILQNMITDHRPDSTSQQSEATSSTMETKSRRPMKKRRLMEPPTNIDTSDGDKDGISFERIGKLIGERWQEVKAKPELFAKYERLASNDHKRYMGEMKSYYDRKKNVLRNVMEASAKSTSSDPSTIESQLPSEAEHQSSSSGEPARASPDEQPSDNNADSVRNPLVSSSQDVHHILEQHNAGSLINLQSLLAANRTSQQQGFPIEYFTTPNQIPSLSNANILSQLSAAHQLPFRAFPQAVPETLNLTFLRQQEELALLRQETLYREFMQMEQARAYLAGSQGLQVPQQQLGTIYSAHPSLEALLAQQSGLQYAALQAPQQAQLASLLTSQLQNPAVQGDDDSYQQINESQLEVTSQEDAQDEHAAAALLAAYTEIMRKRS